MLELSLLYNFGVYIGVKVYVNNREITLCIPKHR